MGIDRAEVQRIAELAKLEIDDAQIEKLAHELSEVLEFVATLSRLDLGESAPSVFAPAAAPLREDQIDDRRLTTEQALAAAPEREDGFFLVPPIVENIAP